MSTCRLFLFILCLACSPTEKQGEGPESKPSQNTESFTNPLLSQGADPWVIQKDGIYYYTHTGGNRIELRSTPRMEELAGTAPLTIWTSPENQEYSKQLWAPELHFLDGKWYMYFAASYDSGTENSLNENRRMFVLENSSSSPMNANWIFKGKVTDVTDHWAIDATVLELKGQKYFIWSGWKTKDHNSNTGRQQLYIAKMINPWTLDGSRVMISEPTYSWERNGLVNEGPEVLKNEVGEVFLFYSCSGCWTDDYKLGVLSLKVNGDPLNPNDWVKNSEPMFVKNAQKSVFAPGHNSFFKSPDGCEDWILYHANKNAGDGCGSLRSPRMQKISWNQAGFPVLGAPVGINEQLIVPSSGNN